MVKPGFKQNYSKHERRGMMSLFHVFVDPKERLIIMGDDVNLDVLFYVFWKIAKSGVKCNYKL